MKLIEGLILLVPAVLTVLAIRAWRQDRVRLGVVRQPLGWTALAVTAGAWVLLVVFLLRMNVVNQRVRFPENLNDWALTVSRIGYLMATLAVPTSTASIGRTRLLCLVAAVVLWVLYATIFASV